MAKNPWAWHEGENPYRPTPFQVLDLAVTVRARGAVKSHVSKRRQRIASRPERYTLFGKTLSEAEINEAEELLKDPEARLLAELRTHRPRLARVDLGGAAERLRDLDVPDPHPPVRLDEARLLRIVPPLPERTFPPILPG